MTTKISGISAVLNSQFYSLFQTDPVTTTGLTLGHKAGRIAAQSSTVIPAGTILLSDDTNNFVYVDAGAVATNTALPVTADWLLYEVTTASGVITGITDRRGTIH